MKCPYCIKICSKCKRLLVANTMNFNKKKDGKYGLRADCKKCVKKYHEQYAKDNKEKIKERSKKYYEEHKKEHKEWQKQWNKEHEEELKEYRKQYREEHKEEILEYYKQYRRNNPHIEINKSVKRRQLEENQGSGINKEQWYEMMDFFDWKCAYSGEVLSKDTRSIDHIIPLSKGGEHEICNCVPATRILNSCKHNKGIIEWYTKQDFYSNERFDNILDWITFSIVKYKWS